MSLDWKPLALGDEMFSDTSNGQYMDAPMDEMSTLDRSLNVDISNSSLVNETFVHTDFYNDFTDMCNDDDLD